MEKEHVIIFKETYDNMKMKSEVGEKLTKELLEREAEVKKLEALTARIAKIGIHNNHIGDPRIEIMDELHAYGYKLSNDIDPKLIKLTGLNN